MRVRGGWLVLLAASAWGQGAFIGKGCRHVSVAGEVRAGEGFSRAFGGGLRVVLQPIAAGWIVRVLPVTGPAGDYDYAEVATPPYRSVTPLSVSTDFAFRAQDAVGWNPRRFRYVTERGAFERLAAAVMRLGPGGAPAPADLQRQIAAEIAQSSAGRFTILDSRLSAGTADQQAAANLVATHFGTTAHTLEQPAGGSPTPLGKLLWLRFRVDLEIGPKVKLAPEMAATTAACWSD